MAIGYVCDVCVLAYKLKGYQGESAPDSVFTNCPMCLLKTKIHPDFFFLQIAEFLELCHICTAYCSAETLLRMWYAYSTKKTGLATTVVI